MEITFTADKVDDCGIWLGDIKAAENIPALDQHQIKHILSILDYQPTFQDKNRIYLCIFADDFPSTDLITHEFAKAFEFIDQTIEQGHQILVHCHAGRSRSVTIVAMYLMRKYSLTPGAALERLKSKRHYCPVIPNEGFLKQLELFYQMNYKVDYENPIYIDFQKHRLDHLEKNVRIEVNETTSIIWNADENHQYQCRCCKNILFHSNDVQLHRQSSNSICRSSNVIFTYFLDWIEDIFDNPIGSINCSVCKAVLGEYSVEGLECSCGEWIKPAFTFQCQPIR